MTPEEKARIKIDQMFDDAGWKVVDRDFYSPTLTAAAIREGLLNCNREADYFLFINGMAVGVLEAKRKEKDVTDSEVCEQAEMYARSVPNYYKAYSRPLPIIYQSNGEETYFRDFRDERGELIEINRIHTPKEIVEMLDIDDPYAGLPTLKKKGLRDCQYEAITELEGIRRIVTAVSYVNRNPLHHGMTSTPFGYKYCSANAIFRRELGKGSIEPAANQHIRHRFLPRNCSLPDSFRVDESGMEDPLRPAVTLDTIEQASLDESVEHMKSNEHGRVNLSSMTDLELCGIIDNEYVPLYGKSSVYHLTDGEKAEVGNKLWSRFRRSVSEKQIRRCLIV